MLSNTKKNSNKHDGTAEDPGSFPSQRSGNDDDDDDEDNNDDFFLPGLNQVLPGVAQLIEEVQVEGTFPDGTKLVSIKKQN